MAKWSERANKDMEENAREYTSQQRGGLMSQISQWADGVTTQSSQNFNDPKYRDHAVVATAKNKVILRVKFGEN